MPNLLRLINIILFKITAVSVYFFKPSSEFKAYYLLLQKKNVIPTDQCHLYFLQNSLV